MTKLSQEEIQQIVNEHSINVFNKGMGEFNNTINKIDTTNFNETLAQTLLSMFNTMRVYTEKTIAQSIADILDKIN